MQSGIVLHFALFIAKESCVEEIGQPCGIILHFALFIANELSVEEIGRRSLVGQQRPGNPQIMIGVIERKEAARAGRDVGYGREVYCLMTFVYYY